MRTAFIAALIVISAPFVASAHEPLYIATSSVIHIPDADTSRAYYGELNGAPAVFTVTLPSSTLFYLSILAPDISGARTDFSATMKDDSGHVVIDLSGGTWEKWHEEFGGDDYLKGPEIRTELPAGSYSITVRNSDNTGKYVLAPGEREVFTVAGTPETIQQMYLMKTRFFNKSPFAVFQGVIAFGLLVITVIAILLLAAAVYLFRRRRTGRV